jgi:hypothetical protein
MVGLQFSQLSLGGRESIKYLKYINYLKIDQGIVKEITESKFIW